MHQSANNSSNKSAGQIRPHDPNVDEVTSRTFLHLPILQIAPPQNRMCKRLLLRVHAIPWPGGTRSSRPAGSAQALKWVFAPRWMLCPGCCISGSSQGALSRAVRGPIAIHLIAQIPGCCPKNDQLAIQLSYPRQSLDINTDYTLGLVHLCKQTCHLSHDHQEWATAMTLLSCCRKPALQPAKEVCSCQLGVEGAPCSAPSPLHPFQHKWNMPLLAIANLSRQHQPRGETPPKIVTNRASQALVALEGRQTVTPEDVFRVIPLCLRHRLQKDPLEGIDSGESEMYRATAASCNRSMLKQAFYRVFWALATMFMLKHAAPFPK